MPDGLLAQTAMLCTPSKNPDQVITELVERGRHIFDVKWDGVRAFAIIDSGVVTLKGRNGLDCTSGFPDVTAVIAAAFPTGCWILDGELLCFHPQTGRPDFNLMQRRIANTVPQRVKALTRTHPATFMAFDIICADGSDLRRQPLIFRLARLQQEHAARFPNSPALMISQAGEDGTSMWEFVKQFDLEGLIAKDKRSQYRGTRDAAWVKLKRLHRLTAIVTGYKPGNGNRQGRIGALSLALVDDGGKLVPIGEVGTGLRDRDHQPMLEILGAGDKFIVEVEYLEYTKEGVLRMPSYKGVRTDVTLADCTLAQVRERR